MSDTQYDELTQFLTKHFVWIESKFNQIDQRFEQIDQRFEQIDQRFEQIDRRFEKMESKFDEFQNTQDYLLKEVREIRVENSVAAYRSRRMEDWITKAAKKINIPYLP